MNEMYDMSIVTHNFGVMGILAVIFINVMMLLGAKELNAYRRKMMLFTPIGSTMLGVVLFSGVVMMAAKHLEFSAENIAMIVIGVVLILLEVRRMKKLKYLHSKDEGVLQKYKSEAMTILQIEVALVLAISAWMWM